MLSVLVILSFSCDRNPDIIVDRDYLENWHEWRSGREIWIKERYLKIFLMKELNPGINTVGNSGSNEIIVSKDAFPLDFGKFNVLRDTIEFVGYYEVNIGGSKIKPGTVRNIFENGITDTLHFADFSFFVFKEVDRYYLRMRDRFNPAALDFVAANTFQVNEELILWAKFVKEPIMLETPLNILGAKNEEYVGYLKFEYQNEEYRLNVKGGQLEFGDLTNGDTSYGGGRYLIVDLENEDVLLDFNKSYSPPCAYSSHTICPLPPPANKLPFKIEAGQKFD